jgi:FlaA1/EpsC-like NDP-sugar epimerase
MRGGEIYVKKIPSMKVTDIASAVAPGAQQDLIGIRPGEKLHEQLVSEEDSMTTFEYPEHFKIQPAIIDWSADPSRIKDGKKVPEGFVYRSDTNLEWMTISQLKGWIECNRQKIGTF